MGARAPLVRSITLASKGPDRDLRPDARFPRRACPFPGHHLPVRPPGDHPATARHPAAQLACCRFRTALQRATSRPYAAPAASMSPSRSAATAAVTSAAE